MTSRFVRKWGWLALISLLFAVGCSKDVEPRKAQGTLDTPDYHVLRGKDMLDQQDWDGAEQQFDLALELDSAYPPAQAAKAYVLTYRSQQTGREEEQIEELVEQSEELLSDALSSADNPEETASVQIFALRNETLQQDDNWLEDAEEHFAEAIEVYEDNPEMRGSRSEPHFYMGLAYQQALEFNEAQASLRRVLEINRGFTREANAALALLDKIVRAQPGTRHGKEVALLSQISRADMAALLMQELQLRDLYERNRNERKPDLNYESPNAGEALVPRGERVKEMPLASDISEHALRADIEEVLVLGVRGLEANPQYLFYPNKPITRAEYALMLEDVLIQVTQDPKLATMFVGDTSPFRDVRPDAYYYNAARTLTSRNIMQLTDQVRGEFGPDRSVHGADALLSLRLLKEELQRYIRNPSS